MKQTTCKISVKNLAKSFVKRLFEISTNSRFVQINFRTKQGLNPRLNSIKNDFVSSFFFCTKKCPKQCLTISVSALQRAFYFESVNLLLRKILVMFQRKCLGISKKIEILEINSRLRSSQFACKLGFVQKRILFCRMFEGKDRLLHVPHQAKMLCSVHPSKKINFVYSHKLKVVANPFSSKNFSCKYINF